MCSASLAAVPTCNVLADMATRVATARQLIMYAARRYKSGAAQPPGATPTAA
jgi:alkylation response protein AidB-like acyl-CoA dehydrogenase